MRNTLEQMTEPLNKDLTAFNLEVFPKQDRLTGKGLGNLVKLPLGIHRGTGRPSYFVACHHRTRDAQLDFLSKVKPVSLTDFKSTEQENQVKKVSLHPRWKGWAKEYPELFKLEQCCPPLGQLIAACRNGATLRNKEEKALFQTVGFLPRAKILVHYLSSFSGDYNPHLTDYNLSRLRGTPLGCKRIHSLLNFNGDLCVFNRKGDYFHPLLHFDEWEAETANKTEKVENLSGAIENLKVAMSQVERFLR